MRYVAAYLLASLGGSQPASGDIEKILGSVGIEIDDDRLKQVMSSLSGKDLAEVIEAGIDPNVAMCARECLWSSLLYLLGSISSFVLM